ncbi:hypothetical protein [Streptomyces sp. S465]|uniref:hypothetical protein n=1 Tax=Streptomyces sp. S465 TaxID=2979468 RepID=UPI003FCD1172
MTHTPSAPEVDLKAIRRVVVASSIGTVIEWYDFALYGVASALVFGPLVETRYRFTAIAFSRELNVMVLGGTTPFIATALVAVADGPWLVVGFVIACQALTVLGLALARSPRTRAEREDSGELDGADRTALASRT